MWRGVLHPMWAGQHWSPHHNFLGYSATHHQIDLIDNKRLLKRNHNQNQSRLKTLASGHCYGRRNYHACQKDLAHRLRLCPNEERSNLDWGYYQGLYANHPYHPKSRSSVLDGQSKFHKRDAPLMSARLHRKCRYAASLKVHSLFQTKQGDPRMG